MWPSASLAIDSQGAGGGGIGSAAIGCTAATGAGGVCTGGWHCFASWAGACGASLPRSVPDPVGGGGGGAIGSSPVLQEGGGSLYLGLVGCGTLGVVVSKGAELAGSGAHGVVGFGVSEATGPGLGRVGWWAAGKEAMRSGGAFAGGAGWNPVGAS